MSEGIYEITIKKNTACFSDEYPGNIFNTSSFLKSLPTPIALESKTVATKNDASTKIEFKITKTGNLKKNTSHTNNENKAGKTKKIGFE